MLTKTVFISYSHLEKQWLKRLTPFLNQLGLDGKLDFWNDTRIKAGTPWRLEIEAALKRAQAAILMVGPGFLGSKFITSQELPRLLEARRSRGIAIYPMVIGHCAYAVGPLKDFQAFNDPIKPLEALTKAKQNKILNELSLAVSKEMLDEAHQNQPPLEKPRPAQWQHARVEEYERTNGYMLVHTYRPSVRPGQMYDIFIFVVRHRKGTAGPPKREFSEIKHVEFFFGDSWNNRKFKVENTRGLIGIRTAAWGTFLATCRITFKKRDREPLILHRYIDFEMASEDH